MAPLKDPGGQDGGTPEPHSPGSLRDASAAKLRQHRRRRRQYRCIMSHSAAFEGVGIPKTRGRASSGTPRDPPTETGVVRIGIQFG